MKVTIQKAQQVTPISSRELDYSKFQYPDLGENFDWSTQKPWCEYWIQKPTETIIPATLNWDKLWNSYAKAAGL